jgi:nucleoside-diphosphate-sugar epimerase
MQVNPLRDDLEGILTQTKGLWEELRGKQLFVSGGTGFVGRWLLESFVFANDALDLHARALVLSRDPGSFRQKAPGLAADRALRFQAGDVRDFEFPPGEFQYVIHAATDSVAKPEAKASDALLKTIVNGTRRVLDFAAQAGTTKLLFTSSGAVYGAQPPEMTRTPETYCGAPDPLDPQSMYGEGKRVAELLCALSAQRQIFAPKIARCFAFVGPHLPLDAHFAIGNFIRDAVKGGPIRIQGDGSPLRSYLYAADMAVWLWTILFRGTSCTPYNVGSEDARSISAWADLVAGKFEPRPEVVVANQGMVGQLNRQRYVPMTARARVDLGLREVTDPHVAVEKTIRAAQRGQA